MVLIGRDRDEGRLREDVRAEGRVFGAEAVVFIRLHDVDPRLILMHRIEDDLEERPKTLDTKRYDKTPFLKIQLAEETEIDHSLTLGSPRSDIWSSESSPLRHFCSMHHRFICVALYFRDNIAHVATF